MNEYSVQEPIIVDPPDNLKSDPTFDLGFVPPPSFENLMVCMTHHIKISSLTYLSPLTRYLRSKQLLTLEGPNH